MRLTKGAVRPPEVDWTGGLPRDPQRLASSCEVGLRIVRLPSKTPRECVHSGSAVLLVRGIVFFFGRIAAWRLYAV